MRTLKIDHEVLDDMLKQLIIQLGKPDLAWAFETLDLFWASLAVHIRAENICLFPAILNAASDRFGVDGIPPYAEAKGIIEQLRNDHAFLMSELGQVMKALRAMIIHPEYSAGITVTELRDRIVAVAERLEEHNGVEEEQVYVWPSGLFDRETSERLDIGIRSEIENMPSRFARAN